jgi:hypothetical protein
MYTLLKVVDERDQQFLQVMITMSIAVHGQAIERGNHWIAIDR